MKKNYFKFRGILLFTLLFFSSSLFASVPQKMNYQAVVRNNNDELVRNQHIGMQISILHYTNDGASVYVETQTPTTNANGLVSIEIGAGNVVSGNFSAIDWADGPYFIKTAIDIAGGTSYNIVSVQQLLSVPYALHAETARNMVQGTTPGEILYWNGTDWVDVPPPGGDDYILAFFNGVPMWVTTNAALIPPPPPLDANEVYNPITRKIWLDKNLGASQVATSSTDADSYGDLYQWGRGTDGHEKRTSGTTGTLSGSDSPGHGNFITPSSSPYDWRSSQNDNLWQGVGGINNPCPSGYRLPTESEWDAERQSWGSNNSAGAFASPLKLPVAGTRGNDGSLNDVGSRGDYWSSTVSGTRARRLYVDSVSAGMSNDPRANRRSVRCIKD